MSSITHSSQLSAGGKISDERASTSGDHIKHFKAGSWKSISKVVDEAKLIHTRLFDAVTGFIAGCYRGEDAAKYPGA